MSRYSQWRSVVNQESPGDDKGSARREELQSVIFAVNDACYKSVQGLVAAEKRLFRLVAEQTISLNPKLVPAHMLANRTLVLSLKLDIRMHQRSILYFKARRRSLKPALEEVGLSLATLDTEWEGDLRARREAQAAASAQQEEHVEEHSESEDTASGASKTDPEDHDPASLSDQDDENKVEKSDETLSESDQSMVDDLLAG